MQTLIFHHAGDLYARWRHNAPDEIYLDGSSLKSEKMSVKNSDRLFTKVYEFSDLILYLADTDIKYHNVAKAANKYRFAFELEFYIGEAANAGEYCGIEYSPRPIMEALGDYLGLADGINKEVGANQWEVQVDGHGLESGYKLLLIKALLIQAFGSNISFLPKLVLGAPGSSLHVNMSKLESNSDTLFLMLERLKDDHINFIKNVPGTGNQSRLTGEFETSQYMHFASGYGDRSASVKVTLGEAGKLEDRRPGANSCPLRLIEYYVNLFDDERTIK